MREEVGAREMGEDEVDSFKSEIYVGNTNMQDALGSKVFQFNYYVELFKGQFKSKMVLKLAFRY